MIFMLEGLELLTTPYETKLVTQNMQNKGSIEIYRN